MKHLFSHETQPPNTLTTVNGVVRAQDLFGSASLLVIEHASERYFLRLTKNGKLILTK